jgi:DeoR family glycerol-3-phosphate regulon repressor
VSRTVKRARQGALKPGSRRERIVELVRARERITVEELAEQFGSSRETIRRDLTALADTGRVRKVHGGAALTDIPREGSFSERLVDSVREKWAIATATAALFSPGSTLFVDVGTTTLIFAETLAGRNDLTVITNGVNIARKLAASGMKVFVIGGEFRAETAEMVGTLAIEQIGKFYASDAVITVAGLGLSGAMDFQLEEAQIARAMIAQARKLTVLMDGSKFARDALFQVCPLDAIDRLVVDRAPPDELAAALAAAEVEVVIAQSHRAPNL